MHKILTKDATFKEDVLVISDGGLKFSESGLEVEVTCTVPHGMYDGDTVILYRYVDALEWREELEVTVIDDYSFKFKSLDDIEMDIVAMENVTSCYRVGVDGNRMANYVRVKLLEPHIFTDRKLYDDGEYVVDEHVVIRENVPSVYYSDKFKVEKPIVQCVNGHVVCYDFLYRVTGLLDDSHKYLFEDDSYLNNDSVSLYFYDLDGKKVNIGGGFFTEDKTKVFLGDGGSFKCVEVDKVTNELEDSFGMVVVPVDFDGKDIIDTLLVCYSPDEDIEDVSKLLENGVGSKIYTKNTSFYYEDGDNLSLCRGACLIAKRGVFNFGIPIACDFNTDLFKYDIYDLIMDSEADKLVDKPLDFEKCVFEPYGFDKLTFKVHMRERVRDEYGYLIDYDTDDTMYWNQYKGTSGTMLESDTCYDLGFTEDDVYYQKKCVSETFIRLLVYSSKKPVDNDLLSFDNMYLDSGLMYSEYVRDVINKGVGFDESPMVRFISTHKFNLDYPCDGYYLYMYPSIMDGLDERTVYLSVRFHHAKYGKSIRLSGSKRDCYWDTERGCVDLESVYDDMYLPVVLKRLGNKYYWYPKDVKANADGELVITLWEPRINGVNGK